MLKPVPRLKSGSSDWHPALGDEQLSAALLEQIDQAGQLAVLRFWMDLPANEQAAFARQLAGVDWDFVHRWRLDHVPIGTRYGTHVDRAKPPTQLVRHPQTAAEFEDWSDARDLGRTLLRAGQVGVMLVAGGMATRLGISQPKGMFPVSPVTGASLFQLFAHQVLALTQRYGVSIPYLIMTSDATHDATVDWFAQHDSFGLNPADIYFFRQGMVPAFEAATGDLLLASKASLSLNPDGHGGILAAMGRWGLFEELRQRGIQTLFYHQVDNPLVHVCDPAFLGFHARNAAEASTKFIDKRTSEEKVGVFAEIDGRIEVIEYSDMPCQLAAACDSDGRLMFRAGNTAIHLFEREFLERIATQGGGLPWHQVNRRVPYVDAHGRMVQPEHSNAVKLERFIFDILPLAQRVLVVETEREREFAPLKNAEGECSPAEVHRAMTAFAVTRLRVAGVEVPDGIPVEISPLAAQPDEELALRDECPRRVDSPFVFDKMHLKPRRITTEQDVPVQDSLFTGTGVEPASFREQASATRLGWPVAGGFSGKPPISGATLQ